MEQRKVIGICADHAGYERKQYVQQLLVDLGYEVTSYGTESPERCDYPDVAHPMAEAISHGELPLGVAICGSGNGINMVMNRHAGVRSALCWTPELAQLARLHNDANVLTLPGRFITDDEAKAIVESFLSASFEGGRHEERIRKIELADKD